MPVDPVTRLEELEQLLSALPGEPMLASTLDGFVAGILVCPTLVLPSEWLPEVWSADAAVEPAPVFETEQQAKDVIRLIMAHYNVVARTLLAGRGRYEAVYELIPGTTIPCGRSDRRLRLRHGATPVDWASIANIRPGHTCRPGRFAGFDRNRRRDQHSGQDGNRRADQDGPRPDPRMGR